MKLLFALLPLIVSVYCALGIDFNRYHSQTEINEYLKKIEIDHPNLVEFKLLGKSDKGREINYVTIADGNLSGRQALYLNGTHHGDEKISTETILGVIDYVLSHLNEPEIESLLKKYVLVLQPLVNPDGHAANTREDAFGRDPNRDYAIPGVSETTAFKTVQIQLVRNLMNEFPVRAAIAFHSGEESVLWPWCYKGDPTDHKDLFYSLSKATAENMGANFYIKQSYFDYPTKGEFVDYAYMKHGSLAVTIELSNEKNPSTNVLAQFVGNGVKGTMAFLFSVMKIDNSTFNILAAVDTQTKDFNPKYVRLGRKLE